MSATNLQNITPQELENQFQEFLKSKGISCNTFTINLTTPPSIITVAPYAENKLENDLTEQTSTQSAINEEHTVTNTTVEQEAKEDLRDPQQDDEIENTQSALKLIDSASDVPENSALAEITNTQNEEADDKETIHSANESANNPDTSVLNSSDATETEETIHAANENADNADTSVLNNSDATETIDSVDPVEPIGTIIITDSIDF